MRISILLLASALVFCSGRNAEACDCVSVPSGAPVKVDPAWKGMLGVGRVVAMRLVESDGRPTNVLAVDVIVSEAFQNTTPGRVTSSQIVPLCGDTAQLRTRAAQQALDRLRAAFGQK